MQKMVKMTFFHSKSNGKVKTISKLSAALNPVYKHSPHGNANGNNFIATYGLPSNWQDERRRQRLFNSCWQLFKQTSNGCTRARFLIALGAEDDSTPQNRWT